MTDVRKVTIGRGENARELVLAPFNVARATYAMEYVGQLGEAWPQVLERMAQYRTNQAEARSLRLERTEALHRFGDKLQRLTDEDWQASDNRLRLGSMPSFEEQVAKVAGDAFRQAQTPVLRLVAVCTLTDREVEQAEDGGGETGIDALIDARVKVIRSVAQIEQLVDLIGAVIDIVREQFAATADSGVVGKLLAAWPATRTAPATTATASRPTSSTDSPPPTDGPDETSSTAPAGDLLVASSSA